jgi:multidrug resistance protein
MMDEPGFIDSRATTIDETEVEKVDRKISGSPSHESIRSDYSQYTLKKRPWRLSTTNFAAIVAKQYRGSGTVEDPFIVTWLDEDFENPKAYTSPMRWSITMLIASMTLCVSLASSAYSGAFRSMIEEFHCSEEIIILGLSVMVLGYAIGPLLWGPICEVYGRRNIFIITYSIYTIFTACTCAAQNPQTLIVLRFFSGVFGSSSLVIPGGQIADLFSTETRGLGIGLFCAAPLLGPSLGPMIGGYIGDAAGWRWVIGFLALYASLLTLLGFLFLPETYSPTLLRQRAQRLSEVTGKVYLTILDAEKPLVWTHVVKQALFRPWVLLFREPIVLILTVSTIIHHSAFSLLLTLFSRYICHASMVRYICSLQDFPLSFKREEAGMRARVVWHS